MIEYDIYARLSQDQQADSLGVDRQVQECREWIAARGGIVREVYVDNDISATTGKRRPAFEALLAAQKTSPTAIVCWHTDRLVRKVPELMRVIELNVNVYGLHAGHLDLSTPAGRAVAITITAWASYEGEQKAERQKAAHRQRAKAGKPWWPVRPFGYEKDGTLHPKEAPILRDVYHRILAGATLMSQARYLNENGFRSWKGHPWKGSALRGVLMNARNAGIVVYNGEELGQGQWVPIVSEETYRAAVAVLTDPARRSAGPRLGRGGRMALLSGFAECGVCHRGVRVQYRGGKLGDPGSYRIYLCTNGHASGRADFVDDTAGALVVAAFTEPEMVGRLVESEEKDLDEMRAEMARLERKGEAYETMLDNDEVTPDQFASLNRKNRQRIAELKKEIAAVGLDAALVGLLDVPDVVAHWENELNVHEKHAIVSNFFDRIVIHPRGKAATGKVLADAEFWVQGKSVLRTGA